ncbi:hypothetical protein GCM10007897_45100 [Sphingobium jiangsuense]|jgi:hypothetical protein|nr:hypothetical protein GCM10007856_60150 [Azospirillum oryzae]GLT03067.1 hypothetical protein GCM10007897_45100 [Sphingobium jiangsuense]
MNIKRYSMILNTLKKERGRWGREKPWDILIRIELQIHQR